MELHAAFGTLLLLFVLLEFVRQTKESGAAQRMHAREFSRRMSRMIYLMLYGMLLLKALTAFILAASEQSFLACGERFRGELVCGIAALCLIRALSASLPVAADSGPGHARPGLRLKKNSQ